MTKIFCNMAKPLLFQIKILIIKEFLSITVLLCFFYQISSALISIRDFYQRHLQILTILKLLSSRVNCQSVSRNACFLYFIASAFARTITWHAVDEYWGGLQGWSFCSLYEIMKKRFRANSTRVPGASLFRPLMTYRRAFSHMTHTKCFREFKCYSLWQDYEAQDWSKH